MPSLRDIILFCFQEYLRVQTSKKNMSMCPMSEIKVGEEHLTLAISLDTAIQKPRILEEVSAYEAKKCIPKRHLYIILPFALINIIVIAAIWKVYSDRGTHKEKLVIVVRCCMDSWILHRDKCYYFSETRDTWNNSQKFCESHNSSLADIENELELSFLLRYKGSSNHWIGLIRNKDDTGWIWTNGTSYSEDIFPIERLQTTPKNSERVFLNDNGLKSESGRYVKKWICNTKLSAQPP
ncbi:C-type lectin domain family 2 member D-like [Lithobates pipiens]